MCHLSDIEAVVYQSFPPNTLMLPSYVSRPEKKYKSLWHEAVQLWTTHISNQVLYGWEVLKIYNEQACGVNLKWEFIIYFIVKLPCNPVDCLRSNMNRFSPIHWTMFRQWPCRCMNWAHTFRWLPIYYSGSMLLVGTRKYFNLSVWCNYLRLVVFRIKPTCNMAQKVKWLLALAFINA